MRSLISFPLRAPIAVFLAGLAAAVHIGKIPPAIGVLRDALGVSLVEAGFLLSAVQLAGMLLGVLVGALADGFGLRRSMLYGLGVLCIASLAGVWARQAADLLALRALEGLGFLWVVLPAPSLMRLLVPAARLPAFMGLWGAYMPAGVALALLAGPVVMGLWNWQAWWGLLGVLAGCAGLWLALAVGPDARRATVARPRTDPPPPAVVLLTRRLRLTLASPGPWVVAVAFGMYSCQWLAVIGFLPSIYMQAGVSGVAAGALTALACAANVVGNLGAGGLMRAGWRTHHLLVIGFGGTALATVVAFSPFAGDGPVLRFAAVVAFSAMGGMIPATLFALAVRLAPSESTVSTTMGWVQQCSACGQFVGPPLVAWVAGLAGGWHFTWVVTGVASVVGLGLSWWVCRQRPA
ncbi:MFS transporter [Acidovorax sp. ACV01]|uniref:MFS transporter n=1 Tax=Acidovorax sp. ACV01 TaxID=2769311 RepID=UPI001781FF86|nr:MFS transporter [Acidovorax sp. ACV01]